MTVYVVVDVETVDTKPGPWSLISIGAEIVGTGEDECVDGATFYSAVSRDFFQVDPATWKWWSEQEPETIKAAFFGGRGSSLVAHEFREWVVKMALGSDAYFAAAPVTFDYAHVQEWLAQEEVEDPFHYRTLDVRSLAFGLSGDTFESAWGEYRVEPTWPHHALSDASALASTLRQLLAARTNQGVTP